MEDLTKTFEKVGGEFISPFSIIAERLAKVEAFIFDWDGVFNDSTKHSNFGSPFAEVDAMGTNMLRFSHFLRHGNVPKTFVVTGEQNDSGRQLAEREHFDGFFSKIKDKKIALDYITSEYGISPDSVCFFFDDILDLSVAKEVGLRMMVRHLGSPMFDQYVKNGDFGDYISGNIGGAGAVREHCELLIGANENFDDTLHHRITYSETYQQYLSERQSQNTQYYTLLNKKIAQV